MDQQTTAKNDFRNYYETLNSVEKYHLRKRILREVGMEMVTFYDKLRNPHRWKVAEMILVNGIVNFELFQVELEDQYIKEKKVIEKVA